MVGKHDGFNDDLTFVVEGIYLKNDLHRSKVDRPIINPLPMIEHIYIFFIICASFWVI
jgi:hypothetical protein